MLNKFIATTVKPTAQDVMDAWEGTGNRVQAVTEDIVTSYVYMKDIKEGDGFDITRPLEMALREEGPCFIINRSIKAADKFCQTLQEELEIDLSALLEQYLETGEIAVKIADDVFEYVKEEASRLQGELVSQAAAATETKEESIMSDVQLQSIIQSVGLHTGMEIHLGNVKATIRGFSATDEGVRVGLAVGNKETIVPIADVMEAVANQNKLEEETTMTKGTVKLNPTMVAKQEEEVAMTTANVEVVEVATEEVIAASPEAMAFLNATAPTAAPVISAPSAGVTIVLPTQTETKEETTMTTQTTQGTQPIVQNAGVTQGTYQPGNTQAKGPTMTLNPAVVGAMNTPVVGDVQNVLSANAGRYTSSANASQTLGGAQTFKYTPWYLEAGDKVITGAAIDNNIVEVALPNGGKEVRLRNKDLGVDLVALNIVDLYNAGKMKFLPQDYQLVIELKMANDSVVIPFQVGIYGPGYARHDNDVAYGRKVKSTPIFANNIKRVEYKGKWTSELMLSAKNEKSYVVKCSCGTQNTIDPKNMKQVKSGDKVVQTVATQACWKDACKKPLTIAEVAQDAQGNALEFKSQGYTQRRLPFGFQFGEEVLAQVMAFAHVILEADFTLGK